MKHMRKVFSLIMALVMVVCLAVPAFAASTDEATVTVYVTTGMFTKGGIDENGNKVDQKFIGGNPKDHLVDDFVANTVTGSTISTKLSTYRAVYGNPDLPDDVNVLDAIIQALQENGFSCTGGWDTWSDPNGGYISTVEGFNGNPKSTTATVNGVKYTKYYGQGWNIAIDRGNGYEVPEYYGTSYVIEPGMSIVFDFSDYELYYPAA